MPDRSFAPDRGLPMRFIEPDRDSGTSTAVIVRPGETLAHTALMRPVDRSGKIVHQGEPGAQADRVLSNLNWALSAAGTGRESTVKMTVYVADETVLTAARDSVAQAFPGPIRPAVSWIVNRQPAPAILVTMDAVAVAPSARDIAFCQSDLLPSWHGAAHVSVMPPGDAFYFSGLAATGTTPNAAAENTLRDIHRTLRDSGLSLEQVTRIKVFISSMSDSDISIRAIAKYFGESRCPPIVITESPSDLERPVKMEMIAVLPSNRRDSHATHHTPTPMPHAYKGFKWVEVANTDSHGLVYFSGITPPSDLPSERQFTWAYDRLRGVYTRPEAGQVHLIKGTHFLRDMPSVEMLENYLAHAPGPESSAAASFVLARGGAVPGTRYTLDMIAFSEMRPAKP